MRCMRACVYVVHYLHRYGALAGPREEPSEQQQCSTRTHISHACMHTHGSRPSTVVATDCGVGAVGHPPQSGIACVSRTVGVVYLHVEVQVYWLWICGGALCARPPLCWPMEAAGTQRSRVGVCA